MKSLVLFLFLVDLSLAQVGKHHNGRWLHWLPPPHHTAQVCPNREFAPNTWPKVAMHQMILPASSSGNVGWRHNQGFDNWLNPFFFGYPNFFSPWGYQPQYQNGMLPRYPGRLPLPMSPHFGLIQWPMQQQMGPIHGQWPGSMGPKNRPWPMYPHMTPTHGPWPLYLHMAPHIPPYYLADRNRYYVK